MPNPPSTQSVCPTCGSKNPTQCRFLAEQLDQAERRAEEERYMANMNATHARQERARAEAAESLAASYREGLEDAAERFDDIAARPLAGFSHKTGMESAQQIAKSAAFEARSLLNPSSTGEGDA